MTLKESPVAFSAVFLFQDRYSQSNMANKKVLTLVFVREGDKILLGLKKRGFGKGKWNGFGGKVERGETIKQATIRYNSDADVWVVDQASSGRATRFLFLESCTKKVGLTSWKTIWRRWGSSTLSLWGIPSS